MPEAVDRRHRAQPDRPRDEGLAGRRPARRPGRDHRAGRRWTRCPAWTPATMDDLMLGCAEPEAKQGVNMARRVAVALGYDSLPGTTVNRFCASSVQTSRMAFHAIKAGEGDVFVSAGVECVSQLPRVQRRRRRARGVPQPRLRRGAGPHRRRPPHQRGLARPARGRPAARRLHRDGPDRGEPGHVPRHQPGRAGRVRRPLAEPRREGDRGRLLRPRDHPGHARPTGTVVSRDDGPRPGVTLEGVSGLKTVFRERGHGHRRQLLPAQRRRRGRVIMSDTRAAELGLTPLARIVVDRGLRALARRSWGSDRSRRPGGRWRWPA